MTTHDNKEAATPSEAREAIVAGLTPMKVQLAVASSKRATMARKYGFERNVLMRLALRWGIVGGQVIGYAVQTESARGVE